MTKECGFLIHPSQSKTNVWLGVYHFILQEMKAKKKTSFFFLDEMISQKISQKNRLVKVALEQDGNCLIIFPNLSTLQLELSSHNY